MRKFHHFFPSREFLPAIADYAFNFRKGLEICGKDLLDVMPIETNKIDNISNIHEMNDIYHFELSQLDMKTFRLAYQAALEKRIVVLTLHDIPDIVKSASKIVLKNQYWLRINRIRYFLDEFYSKKLLKKSSLIIGLTEIGVKEFRESECRKIKTPVQYLPFVQTCKIETDNQSSSMLKNKKIGFIGYPSIDKGYDTLVKACFSLFQQSRYEKWKLVLGVYPEKIEKLVIENGGESEWNKLKAMKRLELLHFTKDYIKELSKLSIMVIPYKWTFKRAASSVLNHAWAIGLPVIATRTNGFVTDVTNRENGILIEPNDTSALIKSIDKVLSDKKLYQKLSVNGKNTVLTNRNHETVGLQYLELLSKTVKR